MRNLYNTALNALRPAMALWSAWRSRDPERRPEWRQRTARELPAALPGARWLHGSSVGEARLVTAMAAALRERRPNDGVAVSAFTASGRAALPGPPLADRAFFLPLDVPAYPERVVEALHPLSLTLLETEIWPNLIGSCGRRGVPVSIVNGRLAPDRMARYRRFGRLYRPVLAALHRIGAQTGEDAARFAELGVPDDRIVVTGNLKYDLPVEKIDAEALRGQLGLNPRRGVWIAGSTAEGEDELLLETHARLRGQHPDLLLILAPRHPRRADRVAKLVRQAGLRLTRRSADLPCDEADVLLVDTLGELGGLYALAQVAFVAGSLVPVGGHNLLEPAQLGVPVLFGPHVEHVAEMAETLRDEGAATQVGNAPELTEELAALLNDDERRQRMGSAGRRMVEANRGALERSLGLVLEMDDAR